MTIFYLTYIYYPIRTYNVLLIGESIFRLEGKHKLIKSFINKLDLQKEVPPLLFYKNMRTELF